MENNITKLIADYPKLIERINRNIESNEQFAKIMAESEKRRLQARDAHERHHQIIRD